MASHPTDIQTGDLFLYGGLTGEATEGRILTILGVSVDGNMSYRCEFPDGEILGSGIGSIQYSEALIMIEQGIWKRYEE